MRFIEKLNTRIKETKSSLCVGLDPRPSSDSIAEIKNFLLNVIHETAPFACAFKPNIAYFEAMGVDGLKILEDILPEIDKTIPVILDAKRGDIGETQKYYAQAYFERMNVDAITLNPFMGYDTLEPFLNYHGKGIYLLAVTSNAGSQDIERQQLHNGRKVYHLVGDMVSRAKEENRPADVGMVIGLTNSDDSIFNSLPDAPLLLPGLGAQGGDLETLGNTSRNSPSVINVSRGILYQDPELTFAEKAKNYALKIRQILHL